MADVISAQTAGASTVTIGLTLDFLHSFGRTISVGFLIADL
jgi:hypothetical protein